MQSRMLYVGPLPHPRKLGGGAVICGEVMDGLANRDFHVHALTPGIAGERATGVGLARFPTTVYPMPPELHDIRSEAMMAQQRREVTAALPALIRDIAPQVLVVGHVAWAWGLAEIAARHGLPWLVWVHSVIEPSVRHELSYPDAAWRSTLADARRANLSVGVARHISQMLESMDFSPIVTIANGVDLRMFSKQPANARLASRLGIQNGDTVVLHASTLRPVKRGLVLVRSACLALQHNASLRYIVAGEGDERAAMIEAVQAANLADRFCFVGAVSRVEMPAYYALSDIVVMPSLSEGMALTYLEAQACECSLVASDIPAAREVVHDGMTGHLVPVDRADLLAKKTLEVAANPQERARIGRQARRSIEANYDIDSTVNQFAKVTLQLMRARRASE